jgi:hypothetical protein
MKCPIILLVMMCSPRFKISDQWPCTQVGLSVEVVLLKPPSLISGEPPSRLLVEEIRAEPTSHVGDGATETTG